MKTRGRRVAGVEQQGDKEDLSIVRVDHRKNSTLWADDEVHTRRERKRKRQSEQRSNNGVVKEDV
jgi:hypothetical protein